MRCSQSCVSLLSCLILALFAKQTDAVKTVLEMFINVVKMSVGSFLDYWPVGLRLSQPDDHPNPVCRSERGNGHDAAAP